MIGKEAQVELWELKGHGELVVQLVDDVKELEEHGGEASIGAVAQVAPLVEPVTEGQPLLLYEGAEALQGPIVGVKA